MASTYTANAGIEKIGAGEQAGTWGTTTNLNMDIIDRAINGVGAITLSATTHTLTTTDGALSDGGYRVLVFSGTPGGNCTVTISPNDQDKLYFVVNSTSGGYSVIMKQGTGDTVTVTNGKTAIVYADGAGSGAAVAQIETGSSTFTEDVTMKTSDGHLLTLQTSDTTVTSGDVLGGLQFQAPNESSGTDSIAVGASILGVAEDTFAADNNKTKLSFRTGASEAAAEKMALDNGGDLKIVTDGASIFFGADSEIELRHVADDGLILKHVGTGDGKEPSLTFQAGDNDIAVNNLLGAIYFQAPDEGAGTDAVLVSAGIEAVSEGDFSSSNNATKLSFKTGASETATEKASLSSGGVFAIPADGSASTNAIFCGASNDLKLYHDGSDSHVNNSTGVLKLSGDAVYIQNAANNEAMATFAANGAATLYYDNSAKIATASGGATITGAITATGNITAYYSDERLKDIHGSIENALDKVMSLDGFTFSPNEKAKSLGYGNEKRKAGVSAQKVQEILPEAVVEAPISPDYLAVQHEQLIPLLVNAIKELKTELNEHKKGCSCGSNK